MTTQEAIKFALEALEKDPVPLNAINNAQYFLRQALAQPEQKPVDIHCPSCLHSFSIVPVAKRKWVGLHLDDMPETYAGDKSFLNIAKWAETKLKEKNT